MKGLKINMDVVNCVLLVVILVLVIVCCVKREGFQRINNDTSNNDNSFKTNQVAQDAVFVHQSIGGSQPEKRKHVTSGDLNYQRANGIKYQHGSGFG